MLNNWDVAQQFLGDIYSTWHIIAIVCAVSLRMLSIYISNYKLKARLMLSLSSHIHCLGHHDALAIPHRLVAHLCAGYCGQCRPDSSSLVCLLWYTQQVKQHAILTA